MVDVLAVALEISVDLLLCEVQGIRPVDLPALEQCDGLVAAVIDLLEHAVVQAGVDHQHEIAQVEGVSYGMLV